MATLGEEDAGDLKKKKTGYISEGGTDKGLNLFCIVPTGMCNMLDMCQAPRGSTVQTP